WACPPAPTTRAALWPVSQAFAPRRADRAHDRRSGGVRRGDAGTPGRGSRLSTGARGLIGVGAAGPLGVADGGEGGAQQLTVVQGAAFGPAAERAAWISLASVPGIGPVGFAA